MKITQASVLGLLGITSAVTPSERRPLSVATATLNKYPLYKDVTAPIAVSAASGAQLATPTLTAQLMGIVDGVPTATALAGDVAGVEILLKAYYDSSPYACFRKNMYYFATQYLTSGNLNGNSAANIVNDAVATVPTANTRSFWQQKPSQAGTDFSSEDSQIFIWKTGVDYYTLGYVAVVSVTDGDPLNKTGAKQYQFGGSTKTANGASWACCNSTGNQNACNGGVSINAKDGKSAAITDRLVFKAYDLIDNASQALLVKASAGSKMGSNTALPSDTLVALAGDVVTYNNDLLLASMLQDSHDVAFGTASRLRTKNAALATITSPAMYCDYPVYSFAKVTSPSQEFVTAQGFKGTTKCTYQLQVVDKTMAPGFKLTVSDYRNYLIHWMEWLKDTDLKILSADPKMNPAIAGTHDTTSFKLGLYDGVFKYLQPLTGSSDVSTTWPSTGTAAFAWTNMQTFADQSMWLPGSPGKVVWTPRKTGIMETVQHVEFDAGLISEMIAVTTAGVSAFNTDKTAYDALKTTYNTALADEKKRDAAATPDPIVIPVRPCPPTVPATYSGPSFTTWAATQVEILKLVDGAYEVDTAARGLAGPTNTVLAKVQPKATLNAVVKSKAETGMGNQWGYLQTTDDTTSVATHKLAGKSFGRLGQADSTMPDKISPWKWDQTAATANTATMMISFFPQASSDTGLAVSKGVVFTASQKAWATYADYQAPAAPTAAVAPNAVSAVYLAATSTAAVALALATLY